MFLPILEKCHAFCLLLSSCGPLGEISYYDTKLAEITRTVTYTTLFAAGIDPRFDSEYITERREGAVPIALI